MNHICVIYECIYIIFIYESEVIYIVLETVIVKENNSSIDKFIHSNIVYFNYYFYVTLMPRNI